MNSGSEPAPTVRAPLNRVAIVEAALELVSASGLAALSLRRLASDLGVTAPALYAHVRDKSDLLAALADRGFRHLLDRYSDIDTDDPIERIKAQCIVYVDLALGNPGLFEVMFSFPPGALGVTRRDHDLPAASEAFEQPMSAIVDAIAVGSIHPDHDPLLAASALWTVAHGLAQVLLLGVAGDEAARHRLEDIVLRSTLLGLRQPPDGSTTTLR